MYEDGHPVKYRRRTNYEMPKMGFTRLTPFGSMFVVLFRVAMTNDPGKTPSMFSHCWRFRLLISHRRRYGLKVLTQNSRAQNVGSNLNSWNV